MSAEALTFQGGNTHVSFIKLVTSAPVAETQLEAAPLRASLGKASGEFKDIAAERGGDTEGLSAAERFAQTRALLGRSKAASLTLGEEVFGGSSQIQDKSIGDEAAIARLTRLAEERFGTPAGAQHSEPSRQYTPGTQQDKATQLS